MISVMGALGKGPIGRLYSGLCNSPQPPPFPHISPSVIYLCNPELVVICKNDLTRNQICHFYSVMLTTWMKACKLRGAHAPCTWFIPNPGFPAPLNPNPRAVPLLHGRNSGAIPAEFPPTPTPCRPLDWMSLKEIKPYSLLTCPAFLA